MTLENYISEAVSHGKHKSPEPMYTPFPKKRTDKDGILNWLLTNGFFEVRGDLDKDTLIKHYDGTGEKCFQKSTYTQNKNTHWIRFYDGKDAFMIRTCLVKDLPRGTIMCSISPDVKIHTYYGKGITFEEIKKHFDEQLTLESRISEAVSHGYKRSPKLPKELTGDISEKDDICNWLDYNGYTQISDVASYSAEYLLDCARETPGNYYTTGVVERKGEKVWWITILSNGVLLFITVLKIRVVKMPKITMSICDKPDRNGSGKQRIATYEDIVNQLIG